MERSPISEAAASLGRRTLEKHGREHYVRMAQIANAKFPKTRAWGVMMSEIRLKKAKKLST